MGEQNDWSEKHKKLKEAIASEAANRTSEDAQFQHELRSLRQALLAEDLKARQLRAEREKMEAAQAEEIDELRKKEENTRKSLQEEKDKASNYEEQRRRRLAELEAKLAEKRSALLQQQENMKVKHQSFAEQKTTLEYQARTLQKLI